VPLGNCELLHEWFETKKSLELAFLATEYTKVPSFDAPQKGASKYLQSQEKR
ncbi:hypothetical protein WA026_014533, partial [Henosepilachna vigintioctopunctata]